MSQPLPFRDALLGILGIALVVVMVAIDQTVVSTALPAMVADLGGFKYYAWIGTSYMLMSIIAIPIFGRLGDYHGRKPFIVAAIVIFTLASIACAFAGDMLHLVLGRAAQGFGGGMLIATAFATIPDLFPDAHVRMRWQVVVSSAFGVANAIGPSLGGFLSHAYGWRTVFYVNLPVGLICLWVVVRYLPRIRHETHARGRIDWLGASMIAVALASLQLLLQSLPGRGLDAYSASLALLFVAASLGLLWCERNCAHPILPVQMFQNPTVRSLTMLALLTGFAMFAILFYVPLMFQGGFGLSAHDSGLLITPLVVSITIGSIVNGRIVTRLAKPNVMLYVGFAMLILCFAGILVTTAATPRAIIVALMISGGLGLGCIMPNLTVFVQESVARSELGIATALLQSLRLIGGMLGTAAVGTMVTEAYRDNIEQATTPTDPRVASALSDPQILVSEAAREKLMQQASAAGVDGASLLDSARQALVSAIHAGQVTGLVAAAIALWGVRFVPHIRFSRRGSHS